MKSRFVLFLLAITLAGCADTTPFPAVALNQVIPAPQITIPTQEALLVTRQITLSSPEAFAISNRFLTDFLRPQGFTIAPTQASAAQWMFRRDSTLAKEGDILEITTDHLVLSAATDLGAFYGLQTLRQLMPEQLEGASEKPASFYLPTGTIQDHPAFAYRGMHLDVGRHFFGPEDIKSYLDYMALLKMNYFHWHLTEDQGWRIEIKAFPKLTSHGSVRPETLIGHYNDEPQRFDATPYGGFYTQEEVKEIVAYAAERHITVIPEIELPGHAQAAISAYPELGCTQKPVTVATKWGIFEEVYCPKPETFAFLETVLTEVMGLFPGPYIHIGGDEAPKTHWANCDQCQGLMHAEGLANEEALQSYFIRKIERFVNAQGKQIIGWDEILEGGLAPNATLMSWRGTEGGILAAQQKHNVIMTPTSHCYFDYYQSDRPDEPLAIGGYLPLKKVYSYQPIPHELTPEESTYILGAQGNVWTEYMPTFDQVTYMVFPRILALSEVVWHGASDSVDAQYPEFLTRVERFHKRLDVLGVNYANHLYQIESAVATNTNPPTYRLFSPLKDKVIRYTLNDGPLVAYTAPIALDQTTKIQAQLYQADTPIGSLLEETFTYHYGIGAQLSLSPQPHSSYNSGGPGALINGRRGDTNRYGDNEWLGFSGDDLTIDLQLRAALPANSLHLYFYHAPGQWINAPKAIILTLTDFNGQKTTKNITLDPPQNNGVFPVVIDLTSITPNDISALTIEVVNYGIIPEGAQGAGQKSWTFIDEIELQ